MTIKQLLQIGKNENPRDAGFLLMHAAEISKTQLLLGDLEVSTETQAKYRGYLSRAAADEPVEYITNSAEFFGHTFYVDQNVLIPRDETELLVSSAIDALNADKPIILDIGTGSGCIAISLAIAIPTARVFATDISLAALDVARKNARNLGVLDRITFLHSDITQEFPPIAEDLDLIISNPPYIAHDDKLVDAEVHKFQPHTALYADDNGLKIYKHIIQRARLKSGGIIAFEVGYNQAATVSELLQNNGNFRNIKTIPDYAGIERMVFANFA
ncbi:MAG: peptide chain release factor N(5)-glutamine methyltransferase [Oscillospiraceae bacterium]|nr:peptide chain release factor N(5)-glutamine methyltransferase [Oscillospiraceae bacterium]